MSHIVALPVCDGMTLFEYGTVVEALGFSWSDLPSLGYDVRSCGPASGVHAVGGAVLRPGYGLAEIDSADTVVVTGVTDPSRNCNPEWNAHLRAAADNGARVVSICTGAFALAAAGLLDGRRATTHWRHASLLQRRFPEVRVTASELYVQDGQVITGAGSSAGLDLCLRLIEHDHGPAAANDVARRLVTPPYRDGDQAQFVNTDTLGADIDSEFTEYLQVLSHQLNSIVDLTDMADLANTSRRTLHRRFRHNTGHSPLEWLIRQRVYRAMSLLETTSQPISTITITAGFDAEETLRYHFKRQTGLTPTAYRQRFRRSKRNMAVS
ncbi:helix-turn-helix domain-containing protein [Tsukamurella sp. 8F]|uniref:GlxA family transcriptional regulator n=1 Tax=unclassified Tsukamurella TaxID=2633480 RepID=UPI0023B8DB1D|nr:MULTISPECIES: helix-turn-helix domain-containing protein [unclassified Tsukamurella]MDF0528656.1 helix-turn-helix domain-containing protein [Tsukamurella sp. 8J]MDF0585618.1 helix-turn-helix domain-containing protein [Tsukamurella sp. 8F]